MKINVVGILSLAKQIGKHALHKLESGDLTVQLKADNTPVTNVDIEAAGLIRDGLNKLTPDIPIITEEDSEQISVVNDKLSQPIKWFIDPIDGTRTAIGFASGKEDHDGWGIHMGLVDANMPDKGFVYFPARNGGTFYFTSEDGKAYKQVGENDPVEISVKSLLENEKISASVGWKKKDQPQKIGGREYDPIFAVGGERACLVADATSHIGWLGALFSPWDIAASHAVLRAANGFIVSLEDGDNNLGYSNRNLTLKPGVAGALSSLEKLGYCLKK